VRGYRRTSRNFKRLEGNLRDSKGLKFAVSTVGANKLEIKVECVCELEREAEPDHWSSAHVYIQCSFQHSNEC